MTSGTKTSIRSNSPAVSDTRGAPFAKADLSASVPASYRYSITSHTPLWGTVGAKLTKKNSKTNLRSSTSHSNVSSIEEISHPRLRGGIEEEEVDLQGTVTRSTLRRTLSRLSLNAPTITGRKARERSATTNSTVSSLRSRSSPRVGQGSPRFSAITHFRLPRLQNFSPDLRMDLSDEPGGDDSTAVDNDVDILEDHKKLDDSYERYCTTTMQPLSSTVSTPTLSSSPMTRSGFPSTSSSITVESRYIELANLISIIEQSPPLCRSPRTSAPNTPNVSQKRSFSLSKSLSRSKLKTVNSSPIQLQSVPMARFTRNGTVQQHRTHVKSEKTGEHATDRLKLPILQSREPRSYSFPYPSVRPLPSEGTRLKPCKSLNDLLTRASSSSLESRAGSTATQYYDMLVTHEHDSKKVQEQQKMFYPALCTPPRTPRSRHASIVEWFADIEENYDGDGYNRGEEVIACDESALMPPELLLLRPISLISESSREGEEDKKSTEAHDSLMDLIDSFPSPTFMTASTFSTTLSVSESLSPQASESEYSSSSNSVPTSPSNSLWSFQNTNYSPSSSLATPASELVKTPASSYFEAESKMIDMKRIGGNVGDRDSNGKDAGSSVSQEVLASHQALANVIGGST